MCPKQLEAPRSGGAKLRATVLSCYDLPNESQPSSVVLELLGAAVETGPPLARHRERNSFKFFGGNEDGSSNELVISAKLSQLYSSTATFRVKFSEQAQPDLVAQFQIAKRLHVNETKWLILNLRPENGGSSSASTLDEKDDASTPSAGAPVHPTLRVKLLLSGPYRPEIETVMNLSSSWFSTVDQVSTSIEPAVQGLTVDLPQKLPATKYLLIPAIPIAASVVAFVPVILGICVVGLPVFLPLLVVILAGSAAIAATGGVFYFSTKDGREKMSVVFQPIVTTFLSTPTGQRTIYDVGPRPSPQNLAKFLLPQDMVGKLVTSLILDFIGSASYLLPVVGEGFDLVWAPVFAICIAGMYDDVMPNLKYVAFMEELLPFTDVIPSATMGWAKEFGPAVLDQGKDQVHKLTVLARREKSALRNVRRQ